MMLGRIGKNSTGRLHIETLKTFKKEGVKIMKKNLKKLAALGLCAAMGATMVTGCGGSGDGSSDGGSSGSSGKTELAFGIWDVAVFSNTSNVK